MTLDELERLVGNAEGLLADGYYDLRPSGARSPSLSVALRAAPRRSDVIAEIKFASPTMPRERDPAEFDSLLARIAGANPLALSILTEPRIFRGHLDLLRRAVSTGFPVLMKDIVVDSRQIAAAASCGAGAVLLIQTLVRRGRLHASRQALIEDAHSRGLDVVLEVHTLAEWDSAIESDSDILGINNRDLATMDLDRGTTTRILSERGKDRPVIAMSGIETRAQVDAMLLAGADAVLVGTSIMRHAEERSLRAVRRAIRTGDPDARVARARGRLRGGEVGSVVSGGTGIVLPPLRRAPDAVVLRPTPHRTCRGSPDLPEKGGPLPRRRPQVQQRDGPGSPGEADGEGPGHRRDRRRAAWRRDRNGGCGPRPSGRGVHGLRRREATVLKRLPDAPPRRGGPRGAGGNPDPKGCDQRGASRLGHERRDDVLPARECRRPTPLSDDRAGFPKCDWRRDPATVESADRSPAGRPRRLRRRREQCDGHLRPVPQRGNGAARCRGGRLRTGIRETHRLPHGWPDWNSARGAVVPPPR